MRKLSHQEVAEIMMDATPLDEHLQSLVRVDAAILAADTPEREHLYRECRRGLLVHLENRAKRGVPDAGIPYEATGYGRAVQQAIPSLRIAARIGDPTPAGRPR